MPHIKKLKVNIVMENYFITVVFLGLTGNYTFFFNILISKEK